MSLFDVIRYSPLNVSVETCEQLPPAVLKRWFIESYDSHLVMFDMDDTLDKEHRDATNMKSKADRIWFVDSIILKKCEPEALQLLTRILLKLE